MAAPISEVLIHVNRHAADAVAPTKAAIDRGCSLSKFLYLAKDAAPAGGSYPFRCALFRNEDFEAGLRFLRARAELPAGGKIRVTGTGCDMFTELIARVLRLEVEFVPEMASNARGLHFLLTNATEPAELFFPKVEGEPVAIERPPVLQAMVKKMREDIAANNGPDPDAKLPCVFVLLGSATVCQLVSADGSVRLLGINLCGGRSLLGLGKALVGTSSYDEIMELAGSGSVSNVDTTIGEFLKDDPNSPYGRFPASLPLFSFGKMVDSQRPLEAFHRADRAVSLARLFATNIHALSLAAVKAASVTRVVIGGNGARSEVLRRLIAEQDHMSGSGGLMAPKFLRTGHTGAFGAMVCSPAEAAASVQL